MGHPGPPQSTQSHAAIPSASLPPMPIAARRCGLEIKATVRQFPDLAPVKYMGLHFPAWHPQGSGTRCHPGTHGHPHYKQHDSYPPSDALEMEPRTPKLRSRLPSPAPAGVCLFPGRSWPFISGKINLQLQTGAGIPGEGGELVGRDVLPARPLLWAAAENQEGSEKGEERSESSSAACCQHQEPAEPPFLPPSSFPYTGEGERHGDGEWGSRQGAGSSDATKLPPHGHPQSHPTASGGFPLARQCVRKEDDGAGVTWARDGGASGCLWVAAPCAPHRGQPRSCPSPTFPHFQDPVLNAAAATWGAKGGSCKKPSKPACFSHCNTRVSN